MSTGAARRAVLGALLVCCVAAPGAARVTVVGIDGASWNVIDPLLAEGALPHLAALIERGGSAELSTVEPLTSPVVWTSIATGRSPAAHGVTDFFSTRAQIRVPSVYERLAASGRRVGLYDVLMTWPPAPLPGGFVIPGWLRREDSTWPADATARAAPTDPPIFRTVYQGKPDNRDYLEQASREVASKAASWRALERRFRPEVGALTFYAVDAVSHRYWHALEPEPFEDAGLPPLAPDERSSIRDALVGVDRALGEIVAAQTPADTLIVVSDHGFQARPEADDVWITRLTEAIARADLVPERDGFSVVSTFFAVSIRIAPGAIAERDAVIAKLTSLLESFQTLEGDSLLFVSAVDIAERPAGSERGLTERASQWITRQAASWLFDVVPDPTAQAMIFGLPRSGRLRPLWPEGSLRIGEETLPTKEVFHLQRFTGTHHPTAVFAAAGGPIARQPERGSLSVLDIAPLVAYLADAPIPDDFEGSLPASWIAAAHLAENPVRQVAADAFPGLEEDAAEAAAIEDPALVEKLRALGYVE